MSKRGFRAIAVDFVFLLFQDPVGELSHKSAANAFTENGYWSHWVTNVFVDAVGMSMAMIVRVGIMRMAVILIMGMSVVTVVIGMSVVMGMFMIRNR